MKRLPCLILVAVALWASVLVAWADGDEQDPQNPNLVICFGCTYTGDHLDRERTRAVSECIAIDEDYPNQIETGMCKRYLCTTGGYSYAFEGWTATPGCTDEELNDPSICPTGSCTLIPFVSYSSKAKADMGGWSGDRRDPLTVAQASKLIDTAMRGSDAH